MGAKSLADKLAGKSRDEKIKLLAEEYDEIQPEMAEVVEKFRITNEYLGKLGMARPQAWATMLVSAAEAMNLDLDTPEGMGVAALLAEFQLRLV